jgi:hypothetical protein
MPKVFLSYRRPARARRECRRSRASRRPPARTEQWQSRSATSHEVGCRVAWSENSDDSPRAKSVGTSNALSPSHPAPRSPTRHHARGPRRPTSRGPGPARTQNSFDNPALVAGRRARPEAERRRETDAGERPARGRGDGETEAGPVTLTRAAATAPAPPRTARPRGPAARARSAAARPPCTPHQPPPAAAAWTRNDVEGEHPAQPRRPPRRTLPRRRRRPAPAPGPAAGGPSSSASGRPGITTDRHAAAGPSTP